MGFKILLKKNNIPSNRETDAHGILAWWQYLNRMEENFTILINIFKFCSCLVRSNKQLGTHDSSGGEKCVESFFWQCPNATVQNRTKKKRNPNFRTYKYAPAENALTKSAPAKNNTCLLYTSDAADE